MKRLCAFLAWLPLMAVLMLMAVLSGLTVTATMLMIPLVRYLAGVADGSQTEN